MRRCQMPFAQVSHLIARIAEMVCDGLLRPGQSDAVPEASELRRPLAGLEHSPGRPAYGLTGERILKSNTVRRQLVQIRSESLEYGIPVAANRIPPLLIAEDEQDVRLLRHRRKRTPSHQPRRS